MDCQINKNYLDIPIPYALKNKPLTIHDMYEIVKEFAYKDIEYGILLATSGKNEILSAKIISIGNEIETSLSHSEIVKSAMSDNAKNIIFIHNHPSKHTNPSNNDIEFASYIRSVALKNNITLSDSIIIADNDYKSYQDRVLSYNKTNDVQFAKAPNLVFKACDELGDVIKNISPIFLSVILLFIYEMLSTNQPLPELSIPMLLMMMLYPIGWLLNIIGRLGKQFYNY